MVANSKPPSTRSKVKTGCRTCKIRKVKCDESWPVCLRCTTTGRHCDGYGIWGGGSRQSDQKVSPKAAASLPSIITPTQCVPANEQSSMEWFVYRTARKLSGSFPSIFWTDILPQASTTSPAIRHAILTLSSVHKKQALQIDKISGLATADTSEQFTLQQYTRSTRELRQQIGNKSRFSARVALLSCAVFVDLEYLRGYYTSALTHLQYGLALLGEIANRDGEVIRDYNKDVVDKWLLNTFTSLCLQAKLYGQEVLQPEFITKYAKEVGDEAYSLSVARHNLELIILQIINLTIYCDRCSRGPSDTYKTAFDLHSNCMTAKAELDTWAELCEVASANIRPATTSEENKEKFAWKLLRVYHTMALAMIAKCLQNDTATSEASSNTIRLPNKIASHQPLFSTSNVLQLLHQSVLDQSEILIQFVRSSPTHDNNKSWIRIDRDASEAIADIGWIPPIYHVAIHSDSIKLRRRAIELLRLVPHREGIWNSLMAAAVAEKVLQVDELNNCEASGQTFNEHRHVSRQGYRGDVTSIPNSIFNRCRAVDVQVSLPKDPGASLILKLGGCACRDTQSGEDGFVYELTPEHWSRDMKNTTH